MVMGINFGISPSSVPDRDFNELSIIYDKVHRLEVDAHVVVVSIQGDFNSTISRLIVGGVYIKVDVSCRRAIVGVINHGRTCRNR